MKKIFEQVRELDFGALGQAGAEALDPKTPVRKPTNGNDNVVVTPPVITKKLDMSLLKPFKPTSTSDKGQRITVNGVTYTFYQNGKVWVSNLKKHVDWTSKNGKILVNGVELKPKAVNTVNHDDEIARGKLGREQMYLIKKAVYFYESMCSLMLGFDWDEERILNLIAKYVTPENAPYIDALIRMINGDMVDYRRKYLPAYNYWVSRGGQTGTTFEYLVKLRNKYMKQNLGSVVTGSIADWLDLDSKTPKMVKLKKQLIPIFPNIMKITPATKATDVKMIGRLDGSMLTKEIVIDIYKKQVFGPIKKIK